MKISCVVTVLNEEKTILGLLEALTKQSLPLDEVIIVDGGSSDRTVSLASDFQFPHPTTLKILQKSGNRSVGRNEGIRHATGEIILSTDAGCTPEKHWVEEITHPFSDPSIDVVAGYYESKAHTVFQECLVPYVFVMPDKIKPNKFLPATRSMAFKRDIWEKVGGFPERYSHNEDYVFAHTLKKAGAKIWFRKEAIVYWIPRETFSGAFTMFYRFAYGDMEAGIVRPKVAFLFVRYLVGLGILALFFITQSVWFLALAGILVIFYILWSILKSYRYIDEPEAIVILPLLQFTADIAVLIGTTQARLHRIWGTRKTS